VNNGIPEQNGVEYWFRAEEEVLADVQAGSYLEAEVIHGQQVSGISTRELKKATDEHKIAITDVDIGGAEGVAELKPDTISILVLPPSFEEWQRRIHERGEMPPDEFRRRMQTAARIFAAGIEQEFLVPIINDRLEDAVADVHCLATTGEYDISKREQAKTLLEELYTKTNKFLSK
jgi:guanylate kinase